MVQPALQFVNVSKTYPSESGSPVKALQGLDLSVKTGEFVALIGSTGCGKTTLLNIIAGLENYDEGEMVMAEELKLQKHIPCVFQHYTLFPWRTLLGNISFGFEVRKMPRKERNEAAMDVLSKVGLKGFENSYPHELSGGMRQRAAIAQTLALKPRLLLMDEPFGALDDSTRNDLQQMVIDIWQESGITILFVTHNIDEAVALADRVIVMSDRPGRIVKDIPVDLPRPRDRVSSEFTDIFFNVRKELSSTTS